MSNLLKDIPPHLPQELTQVLARGQNVRIERIVSEGQASPLNFWYDQNENEWVLLIQGEASIEFASGEIRTMIAGDYLLIPAHIKHRVKSTSTQDQTIWLAIFYQ